MGQACEHVHILGSLVHLALCSSYVTRSLQTLVLSLRAHANWLTNFTGLIRRPYCTGGAWASECTVLGSTGSVVHRQP